MNEAMQNNSTDKGWVAMRALLDQEMPVQPKRRTAIWWWLALLLLPLVAIGTGYLWYGTTQTSQPPVLPVETSVAPFATTTRPVIKEHIENQDGAISSFQEKENQQGSSKTIKAITSNGKKQTRSAAPSNLQNAAWQPESTPISSSLPTELVKGKKDISVASPNPIAKTIHPTQSGSERPSFFGRQAPLQFLPKRPVWAIIKPQIRLLPSQITPNDAAENVKTRPLNASAWRLGGSAQVSTESFNAINSVELGITVQWQALRRWSVRSGLYYGSYTPASKVRLAAVVQPSQYASAVDQGYELLDGAGNSVPTSTTFPLLENVVIPVSKLKILEAPLLAVWEPSRPLTLFAGLNTAYVLAAQTNDKSYAGDFTLTINAAADARSLNTLAVNDLQRWKFDFQTGFGIKVGRQLELGLFARIPLDNVSALSKESDNLSLLSNDLSLVLKRRTPAFSAYVNYYFMDFR